MADIQMLAMLEKELARRFKSQLALEGLTYRDWLTERVHQYLSRYVLRISKAYKSGKSPSKRKKGVKL